MLFEPCSSLNLKYITYEGHDPTSLELTCSAWTHSLRSFQRCSVGRVRPPPDDKWISWMWMWINGNVHPPPDDDVDLDVVCDYDQVLTNRLLMM